MAGGLIRGAAALGLGRYPSRISNPSTRLQQVGNCISGNARRTPAPAPAPATSATVQQWQAWAAGSNQHRSAQRAAAAQAVALCCQNRSDYLNLKCMRLQGELPPFPEHIRALSVDGNDMPTFPPIPPGLQRLDAHGVGPEQLPAFAEGSRLEQLSVSNHRGLTALPPIPRSLVSLNAWDCDLRQLPEIHDANQLRYLDVSGNPRLEQLPTLPRNLSTLNVSGCRLTALPVMPETLGRADFSNNRISDLSQRGPRSLRSLDLRGNPITDVPEWVFHLDSHAEVKISVGHMSDPVREAITSRANQGHGPRFIVDMQGAQPVRTGDLRTHAQKVQQKAQTPTESKNGFPGVDLNCKVQVKLSKSSESDSQVVECRHLATMFAQHAGKKSEMLQAFSTESGITKTFDGKLAETEVSYNKAIRNARQGCKHLVHSDQMGGYLKAIARQLQAPHRAEGPAQANCLLVTENHAMALHVERKNKNGVDYFAAKLFDPNDTANYRRVVKATPQDFGDLKLKDMMIRPALISHYAGGRNKLLSMVAVSMDHRLQPDMDRKATSPSPENMHLALGNGVLEEVRSMLKVALGESMTSKESFDLLQANSSSSGINIPGLYVAQQRGHSDAVKVFAQGVLSSKLSNEEKVNLLAAKTSDGTPGLYTAFYEGHSTAVRAFAEEVLSSKLSEEDKVYLLAADRSDGWPGWRMALEQCHKDTYYVLMRKVTSSNLSIEAKSRLLSSSW